MTANEPGSSMALPPEEIQAQLQRMLSSPVFQRASRPSRFLEFAVAHSLREPGKAPAESQVAAAVFDRSDFDPRLDPIVRVEAVRLRKRLKEYYETAGKNDPVRVALPERGYLAEFRRVDPKGPEAKVTSAPADGEQKNGECQDPAPRTSITLAILPFANLSADGAVDAFCLGLTEDVIAAVTDLSGVCVVARTSASKYSGEAVDLREVGKELGVSHVLEGSVRVGDTLYRASVNLVDCSGGFATWSRQCEIGSEGDVLLLQASLGSTIAEALEEQIQSILAAGSKAEPGGEVAAAG